MHNIKGLAEINTEDWDWIKQLRACTTDVPAIIRTPKGFKSVMENIGYISVGECSTYTDLCAKTVKWLLSLSIPELSV